MTLIAAPSVLHVEHRTWYTLVLPPVYFQRYKQEEEPASGSEEWIWWRHPGQRPCAPHKSEHALARREEAPDVSWTWRWAGELSPVRRGKQPLPRPRRFSESQPRITCDCRSLPEHVYQRFIPLFFFFFLLRHFWDPARKKGSWQLMLQSVRLQAQLTFTGAVWPH